MEHPVLIKFGDNDFYNKFIPLLELLKESDFDGDKAKLLRIINIMSYSFYCISSSRYYTPGADPKKDEHMQKYLTIAEKHLYYGREEVDAFFKNPKEMTCSNGESFYFYPEMDSVQSV